MGGGRERGAWHSRRNNPGAEIGRRRVPWRGGVVAGRGGSDAPFEPVRPDPKNRLRRGDGHPAHGAQGGHAFRRSRKGERARVSGEDQAALAMRRSRLVSVARLGKVIVSTPCEISASIAEKSMP